MKIGSLAKAYLLNRPNFYYHFKSLDLFQKAILEHHQERGKRHAQLVRDRCENYHPDYLNLLLEEKEYIFFQKQLAFRQSVKDYQDIFTSLQLSGVNSVVPLWVKSFGVPNWDLNLVTQLFARSSNRFFAKINPEEFTFNYLVDYSKESLNLFRQFSGLPPYTDEELDRLFS